MWRRLALGALCAACVTAPAATGTPPIPLVTKPLPPAPAATPQDSAPDGPTALDATLIEHVPEGTFGPYLGSATDGRSVAIWAATVPTTQAARSAEAAAGNPPPPPMQRRWFSAVLDAKGAPQGAVNALAEAPSDLALAKVIATQRGFLVLATSLSEGATRIEALVLGAQGELVSGPTLIEQSRTDVAWIEVLVVGPNQVVLWASVARGSADLHLARLDARGVGATQPVTLLEGAKAWQAVGFGDGIALVAAIGGSGENGDALRVALLDADGHALSQSEVVSNRTLEPELDATHAGDHLLLAWVERVGLERRLSIAAVGADGHRLTAPALIGTVGSQRLIGFVPASEPHPEAFLVWENLDQSPRGERRVQIARVSADAALDTHRAELSLLGDARERPEFARKGTALAALTRAAVCPREADEACGVRSAAPTFVEFTPDLDVVSSEPLRLAPDTAHTAELAWGLHCGIDVCSALGALPANPVPIYGVELRAHSNAWLPAARQSSSALPRATEMEAVAELEPLADIAASATSEGSLVVTLTQFDENTPYVKRKTPAPDGRLTPLRALLTVRAFGRTGEPSAPLQNVSYRARSAGGVALAPGAEGKTLLTWTALDQQHPEVFGTLLDRAGKPVLQRMLTKGAGQVSQLAATALTPGFLAAWISDLGGEAHIYSARLAQDLSRGTPQQELKLGAGSVRGLTLLGRGAAGAWLGLARQSDHGELVSIVRLDAKSGARVGEEQVIARSEKGSLGSPLLVAKGNGAVFGWVERSRVGLNGGGAWLVELDGDAKPKGEPVSLPASTADIAALRIACEDERCLVTLDARPPNGAVLEGIVWPLATAEGAPAPKAEALVQRAVVGADPPAFAALGGQVFYADRRQQYGLLRRVGVGWH